MAMPMLLMGSASMFVVVWIEIMGADVSEVASLAILDALLFFLPVVFVASVLFLAICFKYDFSTWKMSTCLAVLIFLLDKGNVCEKKCEGFEPIVAGEPHPYLLGIIYVLISWLIALIFNEVVKRIVLRRTKQAP
ncbi:MAG: hypothetical protein ABJ251_03505 [Paracoccaceae bacterium]